MKYNAVSLLNSIDVIDALSIEIPIYKNKPANSKFINYLNNATHTSNPHLLALDIEEVKWSNSEIILQTDKGISFGLFVANQKTGMFGLDLHFNTTLAELDARQKLIPEVNNFFKGRKVNLPINNSVESTYRSFEDYTSIKEEHHISLWACGALKYLSAEQSRIGKEIELVEDSNPRDGRLDVCILTDNNLLICEAKTTIQDTLKDGRFRTRIPSYTRETEKMLKQIQSQLKSKVVLLIGGGESPLFPLGHPDHMSDQHVMGEDFINKCVQSGIQFVTANFLWCCLMKSLVTGNLISWDETLMKILDDDNVLGLTSAGMIDKSGKFLALDI